MSPRRQQHPELDHLIDEITVDCHDEDEQLMSFENAFDETANLPCPGTIIGHDIEVVSVATTPNRRELIATCRHNAHHYKIALLDLHADPATTKLLAAYRRWTGT